MIMELGKLSVNPVSHTCKSGCKIVYARERKVEKIGIP